MRNKSGPLLRLMGVANVEALAVVDHGAFTSAVEPHLDYLYAFAHKLCGDPGLAEEIVQESLLRAYRGWARLRSPERPRYWLTKIVASACADRFRRESRHTADVSLDDERRFSLFDTLVMEDPFPYSDRLHLDFLDLFDDERLLAVLQHIHPPHRVALVLAYVYGYKAREIAELTGAPIGTVLARLQRGRKQLERGLWDYAVERGLVEAEAKR